MSGYTLVDVKSSKNGSARVSPNARLPEYGALYFFNCALPFSGVIMGPCASDEKANSKNNTVEIALITNVTTKLLIFYCIMPTKIKDLPHHFALLHPPAASHPPC